MEKRDRPELGILAEAIRAALAGADEDALVDGTIEGRCILIDGNFDLLAVALVVLDALDENGFKVVPQTP